MNLQTYTINLSQLVQIKLALNTRSPSENFPAPETKIQVPLEIPLCRFPFFATFLGRLFVDLSLYSQPYKAFISVVSTSTRSSRP
jgi:hypothetical protein